MITINVDPMAFTIGHLAVPWYAITLIAAVAMVIIMATRKAKRAGIPSKRFHSAVLWATLGGLIVAKLVHVIDWWDHYSAHPWRILRPEGWALYGAILGALLALWLYARIGEISFWRWGDVVAPGAPLGQAMGRMGCIIQGCCYGTRTSLPWAVVYTHPRSYAPVEVPLHPAQVYFLLWNLAVFVVLQQLKGRLKPEGSLFFVYLALYSVGDFGLRFLRQGEPFLWGLHQAQVIGLVVLATVIPLLAARRVRWRAERGV